MREAAAQLGVTHVAVREWEAGSSPAPAYRAAIERWSSGGLPASMWPLTAAEARVVEKLSAVVPATSGDAPIPPTERAPAAPTEAA